MLGIPLLERIRRKLRRIDVGIVNAIDVNRCDNPMGIHVHNDVLWHVTIEAGGFLDG